MLVSNAKQENSNNGLTCGGNCGIVKAKAEFSKNQLRKNEARRCKQCLEQQFPHTASQSSISSPSSTNNNEKETGKKKRPHEKSKPRGPKFVTREDAWDGEMNDSLKVIARGTASPEVVIFDYVRVGDFDSVQRLLENDPKLVSACEKHNQSVLHWAAARNRVNICELLIARGANLEAEDEKGWKPLHKTTKWGNVEACQLLLAKGANVDALTGRGWTALHWAAQNGKYFPLEVCNVLVRAGADTTAKIPSNNKMASEVAQNDDIRSLLS